MAVAKDTSLPIAVLHECFDSSLRWMERPKSHFLKDQYCASFNTRWAGKYAFSSDNGGGRATTTLTIRGHRFRLQRCRVVFAKFHGVWPRGLIDHIDGNPKNDNLENLCDVSHQENARNSARSSANSSGQTGVFWFKPRSCWTAAIGKDGKVISLGYFRDYKHACIARKAAEKTLGFSKRHGSTPISSQALGMG